jgi:molybdate transport system substrate-binding protein
MRCSLALSAAVLLLSCGSGEEVTVYAAASLTNVLEEAAEVFEAATGTRVHIRTGASGWLAVEIEHGAPADIFVSADVEWADHLRERGLVDESSLRLLGWNRMVLVVPRSALVSVPKGPAHLGILEIIAMGDPESVPAGKYAAQSLKQLGVWDRIQDRLVFTHDVRAALAMVERRAAEGGFVYASDARISENVKVAFELPERSHDPIVYPGMVLTRAPRPREARRFLDYLSGPGGRTILRSHGLGGN